MKVVPRGIIYQDIFQNIKDLFSSIFLNLNNELRINDFEKKFANYTNNYFCAAFPFARTAFYFFLKAQKLPPKSEIVMPPIHIKAFLDVVLYLNLKPIFVDISIDTLCYDLTDLKKKLTSNTRVILLTYLYGIVPNIDELISFSKRKKLIVIEDFSHCLNGKFNSKNIGSFGDIGIYSSSSIKTLDTYGGGLLVCKDKNLYYKIKYYQKNLKPVSRIFLLKKIFFNLIKNIATERNIFSYLTFNILKILNLINPNIFQRQIRLKKLSPISSLPKEWFTKYSSLQATVGIKYLSKVSHLDEKRINNLKIITNNVDNLNYPTGVKNSKNIYWQFLTYFVNPKKVIYLLQRNKIDCAQTNLILLTKLKKYNLNLNLKNANYIYNNGLFIPCFPYLNKLDLKHIINSLISLFDE